MQTEDEHKMTNFWRKFYQDPFKRYLIISLVILGTILIFRSQEPVAPSIEEGFEVHFFHLPGCSDCDEQKPFNQTLVDKYPEINLIPHDATQPQGSALLSQMLEGFGLQNAEPNFPVTTFKNQVFCGWEETTGVEIEEALQQCLAGNCPEGASKEPNDEATLPIIGKIKFSDYSLASLAVTMGLVDGFNPCAMWVLVYLISILIVLRDKRKIWLIIGSFVFASGVLYFLFMAAWLNAFLAIGYSRPVTIVIGLVALGAGIINLREFKRSKGVVVCEVVGEESRKKTMDKVKKIVSSPITTATIIGIVALAFIVNSIEFVCSAALPAIFTRVLSLSNLTTFQYYGYILVYDFFFMLDDLIIFSAAAFAVTSKWGDKYEKYAKPVGGTIMLILGVLLLFAPQFLR